MIKIGLHSGGILAVDPIDVSQVAIEDIAYGLSYSNRFGGQAGQYTVAEHSVKLAWWWRDNTDGPDDYLREGIRACLIHDAPESLGVGDVNRFIKRKYAQSLRDFDNDLTVALWSKFGSITPWARWHEAIASLDEQIGMNEAKAFGFPYDVDRFTPIPAFAPTRWSARTARYNWLEAWRA